MSNERPQTPRIGTLAGSAVKLAAETAAREVEKAGDDMMKLAADVKAEADALAASLRAVGDSASVAIEGFARTAQITTLALRAETQRLAELTSTVRS